MTKITEEKKIVELVKKFDRTSDLVLYSCTSGYPVPAKDVCLLEIKSLKEIFLKVQAPSYAFFFKSIFLISFNNYTIIEIPISLSPRAAGKSKMTTKDAMDGIIELLKIFALRIFYRSKLKV